MNEQLTKLTGEALEKIAKAQDLDALNGVRVEYLGKKGLITAVMKGMKDVAPEDRPAFGQVVNEARQQVEEALEKAVAHCQEIFGAEGDLGQAAQAGAPQAAA